MTEAQHLLTARWSEKKGNDRDPNIQGLYVIISGRLEPYLAVFATMRDPLLQSLPDEGPQFAKLTSSSFEGLTDYEEVLVEALELVQLMTGAMNINQDHRGRQYEQGRAVNAALFADEMTGSPASDLYSVMRNVVAQPRCTVGWRLRDRTEQSRHRLSVFCLQ